MSRKFREAAGTARTGSVRLAAAIRRRMRDRGGQLRSDAGMSTAEYAVGTIAACGFAAVLYKVVTSGAVSSELQQLVERALHARF
ncbi:DUF4244 domain-containing protein [Streptomyces bathyalis]|uniref:DUF4244 domain-containing protein n=2 Tax=Streptomyces bathyalis TaxID=2710756 RepID=A0A7T1T6L9_9ACTN|nr:DUF4244 domain-containing protein [Streptomyces bathyalis]